MTVIPAPTLVLPLPREEWPDADFDLPEGAPIPAPSDKEEEDWDELDLGKPGVDSQLRSNSAISATRSEIVSSISASSIIKIRPPIHTTVVEDDDEGVSTIKASAVSMITARPPAKPVIEPVDEDFEDDFSLPSELTQLSLVPLSLSHRASKNSLEWGEKDNSSSSQSSDAYSTLGFAESSSSSASLPDTETEEEEDELDGIVIPSALFESGHSASQLKQILDCKKASQPKDNQSRPTKVDPEDDFEMGLVLDDDVDLSPSRLILKIHHPQRSAKHSNIPVLKHSVLRPPSRTRLQRSKSPSLLPTSSVKQSQKIRLSPSPPPLFPPPRSQSFQAFLSSFQSASPLPSPTGDFVSKPGSLRGQKSCTGLKPPSPPSTKKLTRKASLSSLFEASHTLASTSRPSEPKTARYEEPTAASRAKAHKSSMSRIHDFKVPPTRPCTPSSNTAALRLTMPTQSRLRSRPALSQVFGASGALGLESPVPKPPSPLPPRPLSSFSSQIPSISRTQIQPAPLAPKHLRRPKRLRTYGDGTELDHIEDLPTDRDKEVRYRVQPKGYGNRIPGATYSSKAVEKSKAMDKGTARRKDNWEESSTLSHAPSTNTLRRTTARIDPPEGVSRVEGSPKKKKKKPTPSPSSSNRGKPTLIRHLGGLPGPKVVGEMKWNPQTLRWEGNEQILRDFDAAVGTSTRPALITHLTVSCIGSPVSSGARVVGNMVFDPSRMCWISTLPPEQDEPDVFADLADDEEDEWDQKGATIRANLPRVSDVSATSSSADNDRSSPAPCHERSISESGSDRGSRASMVVCDIDDAFIASCRKAEERHRVEMKGWKTSSSHRETSLSSDRSYLYEIRALATRFPSTLGFIVIVVLFAFVWNVIRYRLDPPWFYARHSSMRDSLASPGHGQIAVSLHAGKAILSALSSTYPLKLLSPYVHDNTALVYLMTYGGGLVGGDEILIDVQVQLGARLLLLSQGTTKVFKARFGRQLTSFGLQNFSPEGQMSTTRQNICFHVAADSLLLLLPDAVTCFRHASYKQLQKFFLEESASAIVLDWITSGRMSMGEEWAFLCYHSVNEIFLQGKRIVKDVMLLDDTEPGKDIPSRSLSQRLKPYSCYATLFLQGPHLLPIIASILDHYNQITVFKTKVPAGLIWSVSPIDSTKLGIVVRVAGVETEIVKEWLKETLAGLEATIGRDAYKRVFP